MTLCRGCRSPKLANGNWSDYAKERTIEEFIKTEILERFKQVFRFARGVDWSKSAISEVDQSIFDISQLPEVVNGVFKVVATPDPFLPEILISEPFSILMRYKFCPTCQNITSPSQFLGKVQIRDTKRWEREISLLLSVDSANKDGSGEIISSAKVERTKDLGYDVSFASKKEAELVAQKLQTRFSAHLIKTKEMVKYDRIKSKAIYRLVISARLPPFRIGDIVSVHGRLFQVLKISMDRFRVFDFSIEDHKEVEYGVNAKINLLIPREGLLLYEVVNIDPHKKLIQLVDQKTHQIIDVNPPAFLEVHTGDLVAGFFYANEEKNHDAFYFSQVPRLSENE